MYPEKLHIILAEDDFDDRLLFLNVFNNINIDFSINVYEDGIGLMDSLRTSLFKPHIIFLDLVMPGKSGMDCLREIRVNPYFDNVTVAIYSNMTTSANIDQAFILGANVFIKKPNEFDKLKKVLSDVMCLNWQYITDGLDKENFMITY